LNLLVLGPQGAGKGTQAKRIAAEYELRHISTGDRFRQEIADGTEFGRRVASILQSGELVPDELTIARLREWLADESTRGGFVLDGFPRNLAQAKALDTMLAEIGRTLDAILFFDVPDDVATARLLERALDQERGDDTPEVIARRLAIYHESTEPVVEHYRVTGKLVPLHAERSPEDVYNEIQDALDALGVRVA
jgi:adenylate kinase